MSGEVWHERALAWLAHLPIRLAYRIVWFMARAGSRDARSIYMAMWDANLSLPPIASLRAPIPRHTSDGEG